MTGLFSVLEHHKTGSLLREHHRAFSVHAILFFETRVIGWNANEVIEAGRRLDSSRRSGTRF